MSLKIKNNDDNIEVIFDHIDYDDVPKRIKDLYNKIDNSSFSYLSTGRCTLATIKFNDKPVITGISVCSLADNFCKSVGRRMALARAIKAARENKDINGLNLDKNLSCKIWEEYRKNCK